MKLAQIKEIIKENNSEIHELDLILAVEHLLSNHRSAFLDQRIYELDKNEFKILRSYMTKAIDVTEADGNLINYFFIPLVISSLPPSGYVPITEYIDPNAILNIVSQSNLFQDDIHLSNIVLPRSTVFGSNIYGIFDLPRTLFNKSEELYISNDQLIDESHNQYVYYITGYEIGGLTRISDEDWYDKMHFIESRLSKCVGVNVSILPPKSPSEEMYESFFRDLWLRLSNSLKLSTLNSINKTELVIDNKTANSRLMFYSDDIPVASIHAGNFRDFDKDLLSTYMTVFIKEHNLGEGLIKTINTMTDSRKVHLRKQCSEALNTRFTVVK